MSALKKLLIIVLVLAAILAAIPLLIPYDNYKSDLEQNLSTRLGSPVKIDSIQFSYAPKPQLQLQDIQLGDAAENTVGKIVVPVTLRNLFKFRESLADVSLEAATLKQDFALSLPDRLKTKPAGSNIHIASLKLQGLTIQLEKQQVGPFNGALRFNADSSLKNITLSSEDERAKLHIKPEGEQYELDFEAKNWVLPGKYEVRFDQLILRGQADKNGLLIDDINGLQFGAVAVGTAQLDWVDGWKLRGSLQTRGMQVEELISLASPITRATGRMTGTANFEFSGSGYDTLFDAPMIELKFSVTDGNLHNLDLITPLKSSSPSVLQRGGQTRFDTLTGTYLLNKDSVALRGLALNSGKFTASGNLSIDAKQNISGNIATRLASGVIVVSAPLRVDGTLDAPELRSSGAYKPGAADATTRIF